MTRYSIFQTPYSKSSILALSMLAVLAVGLMQLVRTQKSLSSKLLLNTSISLSLQSLSEIFSSVFSRLAFWFASVGGKTRKIILPGVFATGYIIVFRKSVSLVSNILFSVLAKAKRWEFLIPLSAEITLQRRDWISQRINRPSTFSSTNNFMFKWNKFFTFGNTSGILQCGRDMFSAQAGVAVQNSFNAFSGGQHGQNLPNHDPRPFESRFTVADFRVSDNKFIEDEFFHNPIISQPINRVELESCTIQI